MLLYQLTGVVLGPLSLFWSILTAHVGGVVTRVYKFAPVTYHATETALSSTRLSVGAYAQPWCAFTYSVIFDVASAGCILAVLCRDSE